MEQESPLASCLWTQNPFSSNSSGNSSKKTYIDRQIPFCESQLLFSLHQDQRISIRTFLEGKARGRGLF